MTANPADEGDLDEAIAAAIARDGPMPVAEYIARANSHYYGTRDPIGATGDFITAPEISQMFGELIGLWLADLWLRAGAPANAGYAELGPGRGTLAADALRAMARAKLAPPVHLVETSPTLRAVQASRVAAAQWHDSIATLPPAPLLIVANEFFDALPVRQLIRTDAGWRERCVIADEGRFITVPGSEDVAGTVPDALRESAPLGSIVERHAAGEAIMAALAAHIRQHGGVMLIIDYGHAGPLVGETLQAVSQHGFADPWVAAGTRDLTCHVDFTALATVAEAAGLIAGSLRTQGAFLAALGIAARAATLAKANPVAAGDIAAAANRLTAVDQMGQLFKVLAIRHPDWPEPAA